ncbi:transposase InsO family protein [Kineosporia succinea]|uniref:Transposase InsO family protein n=1 Tax=Kineosporia succinea TaxID=84632 RepID=A0ABT9P191_9ACTN|nr:transposase InsO family protein [Kineosporia succinea]MDP9827410.1 transposase InsO family protein [Kineosporia succinea]
MSRYRQLGEAGLQDASSAPKASPARTSPQVVEQIEELRREKKWSARTIAAELNGQGVAISVSTVGRWLARLGISRRRDLDPTGSSNRKPAQKIIARYPGHMIHVDVKKVGRIPDGGGWRVHGRTSAQHRANRRAAARTHAKSANAAVRTGYVFLHSAVDGFSRLAYTEHLPDEKAVTAIAFMTRARAYFAAHGIKRITRVVTDNGSAYRSAAFLRALSNLGVSVHQRTRPFTPQHNGKVERYQRILAEELLYARVWTSETQRAQAIATWITHYNYHRDHTAAGNQPPAARLRAGVTNVMSCNT